MKYSVDLYQHLLPFWHLDHVHDTNETALLSQQGPYGLENTRADLSQGQTKQSIPTTHHPVLSQWQEMNVTLGSLI